MKKAVEVRSAVSHGVFGEMDDTIGRNEVDGERGGIWSPYDMKKAVEVRSAVSHRDPGEKNDNIGREEVDGEIDEGVGSLYTEMQKPAYLSLVYAKREMIRPLVVAY